MRIWVDADACPRPVKDILFRAAERCQVEVVLVANQPLATPPSRFIRSFQVGAGFDKADDEIVQRVSSGDLVITSDIPLAADVIDKEAMVLSPRGEALNASNIRARLNMRDFLDTMRSSGYDTGGPAAYSERERKQFADHLDRLLAKHHPEPE